jgi:hypothetical protein
MDDQRTNREGDKKLTSEQMDRNDAKVRVDAAHEKFVAANKAAARLHEQLTAAIETQAVIRQMLVQAYDDCAIAGFEYSEALRTYSDSIDAVRSSNRKNLHPTT